jgi:hypothetical protein
VVRLEPLLNDTLLQVGWFRDVSKQQLLSAQRLERNVTLQESV